MYKVGLVGQTSEYIKDPEKLRSLVNKTVDLIKFQYGEDLVFNVVGDIGVSEWAVDDCVGMNIKYHLFLPYPPHFMEMLWYESQYIKLKSHFNHAWSMTVTAYKYDKGTEVEDKANTYKKLVDNSQFLICFWDGMKQGPMFECIKHALATNKLAINAMDERKMITNEDL